MISNEQRAHDISIALLPNLMEGFQLDYVKDDENSIINTNSEDVLYVYKNAYISILSALENDSI